MGARRLLNVVHTMILETLGHEKVDELLAEPDPARDRQDRVALLRRLGGANVEVVG